MATDQLDFTLLTDRSVVREDAITDVDLVVNLITTRPLEGQATKQAINLCVVLDRSGSMAGDKLEQAKRSCLEIWESLTPEDSFSVLAFDEEVISVVNPQTPRADVMERISSLEPGGMTNLSKGWYLGLLEIQSYGSDKQINRIILLSDGMANAGEQKSAVLGAESARARDELGVTSSTIGVGDDFQEDILSAIARESGGRFWYIANARIEEIIREEFSGALSVSLERPGVELQFPEGVEVIKELNKLVKTLGRYRVRPIKANDRFSFALRLRTDPQKAKSKTLSITASLLDGPDLVSSATVDLQLGTLQDYAEATEDPAVGAVVAKYLAAEADEEMVEKLDAGDVSTVIDMLQAQSSLIRDLEQKLSGQSAMSWETMTELERERAERQRQQEEKELLRAARALRQNEALIAVAQLVELLRGLGDTREIQRLISASRKEQSHRYSKDVSWESSDMEAEVDLDSTRHTLEGALSVGQRALADHPYAAQELEVILRDIDEQLARLS
jgi:Ca-activated chloride channel family protein